MSAVLPPWPGLAVLAPRVDLWPVLQAVRAAGAALDGPTLCAAGLSLAHLSALADGPWTLPSDVTWLAAFDPRWPSRLEGLEKGPVVLCAEGNLALLQRPGVAVVGARACTPYGLEWARRIAAGIVDAGGVVVSGLAAGVDLAAHAAAGGSTIAVLGQGIGVPMAGWQRRARQDLLDRGGLVVSEFPPMLPANTYTFPVRNRIIAGLSNVVAVIEAGERSGTRNTAGHAIRFGRKVLALPGPLDAPASKGCVELLAEGARVICGVPTVLEAAGLTRREVQTEPSPGLARWLLTPRTTDELCRLSERVYTEVMVDLGMLQLTGRVIRLPGGRYRLR